MPIAMVTPSGGSNTRSYFHTNRQGSTVAMSADNGTISEGPYTYDAYGNGAATTGVPFKYTGRRLDPETGLYYYRARYYSSMLGRFLQVDPIGYRDQMNLYGYVSNDPLNATDPSGKNPAAGAGLGCAISGPACPAGAIIGAGIGAAVLACVAVPACRAAAEKAWRDTGKYIDGILKAEESRPSDGLPVKEGATVEKPGVKGKQDEILVKPGGVKEANEDFDKTADPKTVKDLGGGMRIGKTANGDNITVRPDSKSGEPTVEVTRGNGKERMTDKFRYK